MKAREQAAALYANRHEFLTDESRYLPFLYLPGSGLIYCTATAYALAHRVEVGWPIEQMRRERSDAGDCWFVFVAAGDLGEIVSALWAAAPLNWVAFERDNHPHLVETNRFPHVRRLKQQKGDSTTGAIPCGAAPHEHVSNAVHAAAAAGCGAKSTGPVSRATRDSDAS